MTRQTTEDAWQVRARADRTATGRRRTTEATGRPGAAGSTETRIRDRGSMTVIMLCVIAGALALALLTAGLVRAQTARGDAQAAADLAALAAAEVAAVGGTDACDTAQLVAARNEANLRACTVGSGGMVTVTTRVPAQILPGWPQAGIGRARAGPVGRAAA